MTPVDLFKQPRPHHGSICGICRTRRYVGARLPKSRSRLAKRTVGGLKHDNSRQWWPPSFAKLRIQLSQWLIPAAVWLMPLTGRIVVGTGKITVSQQFSLAGDRSKNVIEYWKIQLFPSKSWTPILCSDVALK